MVERERELEPVRGDLPMAEHGPRVVDQDVDARLGRRDLRRHAPGVADQGEIGVVRAVGDARAARPQALERGLAARAIARHQHQARAPAGELLGRDLADPGGAAGDDDDLALHARSVYRPGEPGASGKMTGRP